MDYFMKHKTAKGMVDKEGFQGVIDFFNQEFTEHELNSISVDWYDDPSYIMKLKGLNGDVVVGWEGKEYD